MDQQRVWADLGGWLLVTGLTPEQIMTAVTEYQANVAKKEREDARQMKLPFEGKH